MKLYKVTFTNSVIVRAENENEARDVVGSGDVFVSDMYGSDIDVEDFDINELDHGWDVNCLPYGKEKTELTIKEILEKCSQK